MPNDKGYYDFQQPLKKTQPARASDGSKGDLSGFKKTETRYLGGNNDHNFNSKAKVTNSGGNFHDFGNQKSGLMFNGAQKDASIEHLKQKALQGQRIKNDQGGNEVSRTYTYNGGVTAYNTMPIKEVYRPATSQKVPPPEAIKHTTITKAEAADKAGDQTKLGQQIRHSKRG